MSDTTWVSLFGELTQLFSAWAWPIAILLIVKMFEKEIATFIGRLKKMSVAGAALEAQESVLVVDNNALSTIKKENQLIAETAEAYKSLYKEMQEKSEADKNYFINQIIERDIVINFERVHHLIFQSQINLLRRVNQQPQMMTNEFTFFVMLQRAYEVHNSWTFDNYLHMLFTNNLIENQNQMLAITSKGKAFLNFIDNVYPNETKTL